MQILDLERAALLASFSARTWYNVGLVVVLAALALTGVVAYRAWHEAHEEIEPASAEELLATFEQARAAGELDEEEYARVRRELLKSANGELGAPSPGQKGRPGRLS